MKQHPAAAAPRYVAPGRGWTVRVLGEQVTCKASALDTGGAYALFEVVIQPGVPALPRIQRYEDETLWALDGTFQLRLGDESITLESGGYAYAPRGIALAITGTGDVAGRLLTLVTPGGLREKYLEEMGGPDGVTEAPQEPSAKERALAIAAKYGTQLLLPSSD